MAGSLDKAYHLANWLKGETLHQLAEHHIGLGKSVNIIPASAPDENSTQREVYIGFHPVLGMIGKAIDWGSDEVRRIAKAKESPFPDPTFHWSIIVDNIFHELNCDGDLKVIYQNGFVKQEDWKTWHVGTTHFNDEAIRLAGEEVIAKMRTYNDGGDYNLLTNNCQLFTMNLATQICDGQIPKIHTSWSNDVWNMKAEGEVAEKIAHTMKTETPLQNPAGGESNPILGTLMH